MFLMKSKPEFGCSVFGILLLVDCHCSSMEGTFTVGGIFSKVYIVYCKKYTSSNDRIRRDVDSAILFHALNDVFFDVGFLSQNFVIFHRQPKAM
jgi:hypothetical protein